jgi:hypothetical protein
MNLLTKPRWSSLGWGNPHPVHVLYSEELGLEVECQRDKQQPVRLWASISFPLDPLQNSPPSRAAEKGVVSVGGAGSCRKVRRREIATLGDRKVLVMSVYPAGMRRA